MKDSDSFKIRPRSSQRISELQEHMSVEKHHQFFELWNALLPEDEYLALDITSISSCSELIEDVDSGCKRDGEDLSQINLCLLMGQHSRLAAYQLPYQGSLPDVSTLQASLASFRALTHNKPVVLVMDRGFYSKQNADALLAGDGE